MAAIGIFDGVHRGHRRILARAVARARALRGQALAVTFHPHPLRVLKPSQAPALLLSLEERLRQIAAGGVSAPTRVIRFTRSFSRWTPEQFVRRILVHELRVDEVVVGHDFRFGVGRTGTVETLRRLGSQYGFVTRVVPPVRLGGERVSSRRIRQLLRQGKLAQAGRLLGRPVAVVGRVVRGSGRGKRLGFSTANLRVETGVLPAPGVYLVRVRMARRRYAGMANLGFRPTFNESFRRPRALRLRSGQACRGGGEISVLKWDFSASPRNDGKWTPPPLLEVHLFGWHGPLYGRRLEVAFHRRLRSERRFPSAEALARQLARDVARAAGRDSETKP